MDHQDFRQTDFTDLSPDDALKLKMLLLRLAGWKDGGCCRATFEPLLSKETEVGHMYFNLTQQRFQEINR